MLRPPRHLFALASVSLLAALALTFNFTVLRRPDSSAVAPSRRGVKAAEAEGPAASFARLPLRFEPNEGQTDPRVKFIARGGNYGLFLTDNGATLSLRAPSSRPEAARRRRAGATPAGGSRGAASVVKVKLGGANPSPQIEGQDRLPGASNYFAGAEASAWRTNVAGYSRVLYRGVYEGVDLVFYGNQRRLEYDFRVAPGARPESIRLDFDGARSLRVDEGGDLVVRTSAGDLRQHRPLVYQEDEGVRREVSCRYQIKSRHEVGFEVGAYDRGLPLVIDPVLAYGTYLGGNGADYVSDIAVDAAGNAYLTGFTFSQNFPTTAGSYQTAHDDCAHGDCRDVFVAKLNPQGTALVYSTFLRGNSEDSGQGIRIDAAGNAYVVGFTYSPDFPVTPGALNTGGNVFVSKLGAAGDQLVFSSRPNSSARYLSLALDGASNVYVAGLGNDQTVTTPGAYKTTRSGRSDAFVMKLDPTAASRVYSTFVGGGVEDFARAVAVDSQGRATIAGQTSSPDLPVTAGAFQNSFGGGTCTEHESICGDGFAARLNASGTALDFATYLGGAADDTANYVALDTAGDAYVTGYAASTNFPTTPGAYKTAATHAPEAFVAKLDASGGASYSTLLGYGQGTGLTVSPSGRAYVSGLAFFPADFPTTPGAFQTTPGSGEDAFLTVLDPAGASLAYSTYVGGNNHDSGQHRVGLDAAGNAYVTIAATTSDDLPTTPGALQTSITPNGADSYVARLDLSNLIPPPTSTPTPVPAPSVQRWKVTNGFYTLSIFGDGTLLAAGNNFASGAGTGVKMNPHDGSTIGAFPVPDVRTSIRLSTGDQDYVVGGYGDRIAVREDGSFARNLMGLGCCNIPRYPLALDAARDEAYAHANWSLNAANMSNGDFHYTVNGIDNFGMISIADSDTLYTAGIDGDVIRQHPTAGYQWHVHIDDVRLQPGAVAADGSFVVTSGPAHLFGAPQPGRLARIKPDGIIAWNLAAGAVTPPVIGGNNLVFVGTQAAPVADNGAGAVEAYDLTTGALVWRTAVEGLPNDLLVGDDGAIYAATGGSATGRLYTLAQTDGAVRQTITGLEGAWEIVLRAGLVFVTGDSITALPVAANNYDPDSPWPVRFHDNQRTGNRQSPILAPPRDTLPGTFVVNSTTDGADADTSDGACDDGTGHCTLRAAIQQANAAAGANTIAFNIPGAGVRTIAPNAPLPQVTDPVTIDATTQPGYGGSPVVELSGAAAGGAHGLYITSGDSRVRGLAVNRFAWDGIVFQGGSHNVVEACYVGTDAAGTAAAGNGLDGIYIENSPGAVVGGADASARNVISGNGRLGLYVLAGSTGAQVRGNYFGTNASGAARIQNNVHGVYLENSGGAVVAGNVVAGSGQDGIALVNSGASGIYSNLVGLGADGATAVGNGLDGIYIQSSVNVTVGGGNPNDRNVVANSGRLGVYFLAGSNGAKVQGNYVGTDAAGAAPMPNAVHGIYLENSGGGLITNNVVGSNGQMGIPLVNSPDTGIYGNTVGLDASGAHAMGHGLDGIYVQSSTNVNVGGASPNDRNVVGNSGRHGVYVLGGSTGAKVQGNRIGTDVSGAVAMPNGLHGIYFENSGSGLVVGNLVANSAQIAIPLVGSPDSGIYGNFVGTDVSGTVAMGSGLDGVYVQGSPNVNVGSLNPNDRNLIANCGRHAVYVLGGSNGVKVHGNRLGTDVTGTVKMPNVYHGIYFENSGGASVVGNLVANSGQIGIPLVSSPDSVLYANVVGLDATGTAAMGSGLDGVYVQNSPNVNVGGANPNDRNVVANSGRHGIYILGGSNGIKVQGNRVGTDASGMVKMPSVYQGIYVENTGGALLADNLVSNSGQYGVVIAASNDAVVRANAIGTDAAGAGSMGNGFDGIVVSASANALIGGTGPGDGNVIANSVRHGVWITDGSSGIKVQGNSVGTDPSGALDLGNALAGVAFNRNSSGNAVGGTEAGAGNRIAHNGGQGVRVDDGDGNAVLGNSIFDNAELGIDLAANGVTPDDAGDGDDGANHFQNFPVVTSTSSANGTAAVQGTLNSAPNSQYRIEMFANSTLDPSGHGEGQFYLGSTDVTTDAAGNAVFNVNVSAAHGTLISVTATDAAGNTSEFSNGDAEPPTLDLPANIFADATGPEGAAVSFTATATDNSNQRVGVNCSPAPGSTFPAGTTDVQCSATDASGNTAAGAFLVTVGGGVTPAASSGYLYATKNDGLVRLDAAGIDTSNAAVAPVLNSGGLAGLALSPDGARLYVTAPDGVVVIDTATDRTLTTIPAGRSPNTIAVRADGKRAYVLNLGDSTVSVIDLERNAPSGDAPIAVASPSTLAISPDGARLYVGNYAAGSITVINTSDYSTEAPITGVPNPVSLVLHPNRQRLYAVSNLCCVKVIDLDSRQVTNSLWVPDVPGQLTISPDGARLYLTHSLPGGPVTVIDTATENLVRALPVCCYPTHTALRSDSARVYATSSGGNGGYVHAFDASSPDYTLLGSVKVGAGYDGAGPFTLAVTPGANVIDFEHAPGPDGRLGTADDVPLAGGAGIAEQFASLGVRFSFAGGGSPQIAAADGAFVAFRGPGARANYPARSGSNTLGAAENTSRALELNFDRAVSAVSLHVADYDAATGNHLDLVAYDGAGRELSRGRLDASGASGDGTLRRLSVASRGIRRVVADFANSGDTTLAVDDLGFVAQPDAAPPTLPPTFRITVEPGAYTGVYYVNHAATPSTGRATFQLAPGTYAVRVSEYDTPGTNFAFTVDAAGQVTDVTKPAAARAEGATLAFNNSTININPQGYAGHYQLYTHHALYTGAQSFVLVPGLLYAADNGYGTPLGSFAFELNDAGEAVNMNKPGVGITSGHAVTLNNARVNIDPQGYAGLYRLTGTFDGAYTGAQQLTLIPGLYYNLDNNYGVPQGATNFKVDDCGRVTDVGRPGAAEGVGNTLRLKNATVTIDPQAYAGAYRLPSFNASFSGVQQFVLIPALGYNLDDGLGTGGSYFNFRVDSCGHVADIAPSLSATMPASADGARLILSNTSVRVEPAGYAGTYGVGGYTNLSGASTVALISGLKTFVNVSGRFAFFTPEATQAAPASVSLDLGAQTASFNLSATAYAPAQGTPYQPCALDDAPHVDASCAGPDTGPPVISNLPGTARDFDWVQVATPSPRPSARGGHRMVYDPVRHRVILFGGANSSGYLNDVWEFDTATRLWTEVTPSGGAAPIPRANFAMAYDEARDRVVVYGGECSTQYSNVSITGDTWEWNPASRTWTQKPASSLRFVGLVGSGAAYDPVQRRVVLFGGHPYWQFEENGMWAWDGNDWTELSPATRPGGHSFQTMVTDRARGRVVMFGGYNGNLLGDTWEWDGSNWQQVALNGPTPGLRDGSAMAYDSARRVTVLFGGYPGAGDTWEWDGATWKTVQPRHSPSARATSMVYDESRSTLVLFGGGSQEDTWLSQSGNSITVEATGPNGARVTWSPPTATDAVEGNLPVACAPASGSTFPVGTTTVQCTAADSQGNAARAGFDVTVQDTTPPVLSLPADINTGATGAGGAVVNFNAAAADAVGGSVPISCNPASGSTFPDGTTSVLCTASDASGNTASGSFRVTVEGASTPAGTNVTVQPLSNTGATPVTLNFSNVTRGGVTSLDISGTGQPPPAGFRVGSPPTYYELSTTAVFSGPVQVCFNYTGTTYRTRNLRLLHYEGGRWRDVTTSIDFVGHVICGSVTSFSPFVIAEPAAAGLAASPAVGVYGGDTTLRATLTAGGQPLAGRSVAFSLNGASVGTATTDADGTAQLSGASLAGIGAGTYAAGVRAGFAGDDEYPAASANAQLTVARATPTVTWSDPASVVYGTPLGAAQLNATADVPGTFTYTPAAGGVLPAGDNQTLHVEFAPADSANYAAASKDAHVSVSKAPLVVTADDASRLLGAPNPVFSVRYEGFVAGQNQSALGGTLTFTTAATQASPVGGYAVTPSGLTSNNYAITFHAGTLTIGYNVCVLFDQTKAAKGGSTVPVKLQLCDASGANRSAASVVVHATGVVMISTQAPQTLNDSGNANPDLNFRYDGSPGAAGGYIFNLSTKGYPVGTFLLTFVVAGDPTPHAVQFSVR